ncbi:MAG: putative rane protein, partial [Patescibacteria group bacterium]|nr:putative rane protein [Patescibacteria group bacterium]
RDTPYLVSLYLSMNLINTVAPVVGLSGAAYMIYLEKGNGLKKAESILINVLYHLIDYLVFLFILVASLIYLYVLGEITPTIVLTSLVFAGFVIAFGLSCLHLLGNPQNLAKTIRFFDRIAVRLSFSKKKAVDMRKVNNFSEKAQLVWKQSHLQPKLLGRAAASSFCIHAVSLGLLWLSFWAIGISANLQIVAAGYTVGTLLRIVSVTPGGIGFAEGGMTAVFTALGLPLEQSLIVTLLYRTVFTWLPLLLGVPAHHLLPQLARKWNVN